MCLKKCGSIYRKINWLSNIIRFIDRGRVTKKNPTYSNILASCTSSMLKKRLFF